MEATQESFHKEKKLAAKAAKINEEMIVYGIKQKKRENIYKSGSPRSDVIKTIESGTIFVVPIGLLIGTTTKVVLIDTIRTE
ncbi:hypothetical protein PanWU01x14_140430 [Parasponia andersonii]|uniref:Uncharacterized protein n=1 Tax=Parasponia andersonii TaxID=3476 RepID=A0A2P5CMD3_PARAD|nr:hypothetical protein PanWU01x14_140430 [Parasponia andersonii]